MVNSGLMIEWFQVCKTLLVISIALCISLKTPDVSPLLWGPCVHCQKSHGQTFFTKMLKISPVETREHFIIKRNSAFSIEFTGSYSFNYYILSDMTLLKVNAMAILLLTLLKCDNTHPPFTLWSKMFRFW